MQLNDQGFGFLNSLLNAINFYLNDMLGKIIEIFVIIYVVPAECKRYNKILLLCQIHSKKSKNFIAAAIYKGCSADSGMIINLAWFLNWFMSVIPG